MNAITIESVGHHQIVPWLYEEIRHIAKRQRRRFVDTSVDTTALTQAACEELSSGDWKDHGTFLRTTARAMRKVVVDLARSEQLRDGGEAGVPPDAIEAADALWLDGGEARILAIDEALERLGTLSPRLADVVNCRFFAGYDAADTAAAVGMPEHAVAKEWAKARAWLYREIGPDL